MRKIIEVSSDTNIGGAGKCLLALAENIDREKFAVSVILPRNSLLKPELEKLGTRVIEVDGIADKSLDMSSVKELLRIFRREKPDLVHTHASMSARIAARLAGTKIVYTRHSVFPPPKSISKGMGKLINGAVNNFLSDGIIAVAEAAKDNLTDTGVSDKKIRVILNGVKPLTRLGEEELADARRRFGADKEEKVVSIVARLEDIKGHEYFIDAAETILKHGIKAKFFIAGTGSYEDALRRRVQSKGLSGSVIFTGFINDVERLMNITDVQVNASYGTEATSLALLEGMSLGIPAVVSDFGGNPGVIKNGKNGFVVPKKNSVALAGALERLLTDKELYKRMSREAVAIFNKTFTVGAMTRRTEELYEEIISKGKVR